MDDAAIGFEGVHCTVKIRALAPRVLADVATGDADDEHADRPMIALAGLLPTEGVVELFIDAREALGPSTDVSAGWAQWLARHRTAFARINMLTGSRFVQLTAGFVRKWADLSDTMRIYTDAASFETALSLALASPG